jgi:hypothetical protein
MLPFILLAASILPSQQASTECIDAGAETAVTETQTVRGPSGAAAVLKVSTADNHSKNAHLCEADYQLVITPAASGAPVVVELLVADDDYGRSLALLLDGFSRDGKRIFGIVSESNKRTNTFLFDYDTTNGNLQLVDLKMQFAHTLAASCSRKFDVLGTSETGSIILELNSATPCPSNGRWILNRTTGMPARLPRGASILGLYESTGGAQ